MCFHPMGMDDFPSANSLRTQGESASHLPHISTSSPVKRFIFDNLSSTVPGWQLVCPFKIEMNRLSNTV